MIFENILIGMFVKLTTGFDDTLTQIPILSRVTKTRKERIVFSIGMLIAISFAILLALFFSELIKNIPYYQFIAAGLIYFLAICTYFNVFFKKREEIAKKEIKSIEKLSFQKTIHIMFAGMILSIITVLDDLITYTSVLTLGNSTNLFIAAGIFLGAILQVILIIYFAKKIKKFRYKKELATIGLLLIGTFILFQAITT